jgi:Prealbumin-like fold domain
MAILDPRRRRTRRLWGFITSAAALTAVFLFVIASASGNLSGSTFEGNDGNLVVTTPGNTDWVNAPNRVRGDDLASGGSDNSFGQGTKEDSANVTVVTGSIPPQKSDLTRFYVASEFASNNNYLYLAWERSNVLGSANMDFEINKLTQPNLTTTGPKTLNRSAGDLLVTFDFTNGGGNPVLGLLKWLTSGSAANCFSANALPCWGANPADDALDGLDDERIDLSQAGFAEGAVNNTTVTDPIPDPDVTLPALTFGEAAINLTAAGVFPAGTCTAFGSTFLKSRSSASFPAEVKDFVAPQPVNITNCGTVNIHKQDDLGAPLAGAVFTLFTDAAPTDGAPPHGNEDTATSLTCTTLANGNCSILNVPFGDYWAVETTGVPNHDLAADQSFTINGSTPSLTISLTFVDPRQPGAIQVTKTRKHAADGPGDHPHAGVSFTVNGVTKQTDANGVACFDGLDFGTYTVHETVPTGYHVVENDKQVTVDNTASCSDSTYVGESVAFHNTPLSNITVSFASQITGGTASKISCTGLTATPPDGTPGDFDDTSETFKDLEPGTYTCTVVIDP